MRRSRPAAARVHSAIMNRLKLAPTTDISGSGDAPTFPSNGRDDPAMGREVDHGSLWFRSIYHCRFPRHGDDRRGLFLESAGSPPFGGLALSAAQSDRLLPDPGVALRGMEPARRRHRDFLGRDKRDGADETPPRPDIKQNPSGMA